MSRRRKRGTKEKSSFFAFVQKEFKFCDWKIVKKKE
jgi:hypothetical protein